MANPEHRAILKQGVEAWNAWRDENSHITPDLERIALYGWDLRGINLSQAKLSYSMLHRCFLERANLDGADINNADLSATELNEATLIGANLCESILGHQHTVYARGSGHGYGHTSFYMANLQGARLCGANIHKGYIVKSNLEKADLRRANLSFARLDGTNLSLAILDGTLFVACDLRSVKGLETCEHWGPSTVDHLTMQYSRDLPISFLRGCGLPEFLIKCMPSTSNKENQFSTCFISYSHKDEDFASQLYADLQTKGVRCWFAPEDLKTGEKIRSKINDSIRLYDKLLIILSEHSVHSDWVEFEVETALEKEKQFKEKGLKHLVLFPIRLDDSVMDTTSAWAAGIRRQRHIGDFRQWKNHEEYLKALNRLLRDLGATTFKTSG